MHQWLLSNPQKAHKKAWRRFVTNWLSRAQERGGDAGRGVQAILDPNPKPKPPSEPHWKALAQRLINESRSYVAPDSGDCPKLRLWALWVREIPAEEWPKVCDQLPAPIAERLNPNNKVSGEMDTQKGGCE
jgi:hypothetical protein